MQAWVFWHYLSKFAKRLSINEDFKNQKMQPNGEKHSKFWCLDHTKLLEKQFFATFSLFFLQSMAL